MFKKIIRKFSFVIFILIIFSFLPTFTFALSESTIQINEIVYDPTGCNDSKCEWIELYNPSNLTYNLKDCTIDSKIIGNFNLSNKSYLILTRNKKTFIDFFIKGPTNNQNDTNKLNDNIIEIPFSLSNKGEDLKLQGTSWCNSSINYSIYTNYNYANGNNYSLEKYNNLFWNQSSIEGGTPLKINSLLQLTNISNYTINNSLNYTNQTNRSNENNLCDFGLFFNINNSFSKPTDFSFSINAYNYNPPSKDYFFSVTGQIINFYGETIREYFPWKNQTLSKQVTVNYSPNLDPGIYYLDFIINQTNCNDTNHKNNYFSSLFAINNNFNQSSDSVNLSKSFQEYLNIQKQNSLDKKEDEDKIVDSINKPNENNNNINNNYLINYESSNKINEEYTLTKFSKNVSTSQIINLELAFQSIDNKPHTYSTYAYLYKGSVCYSCDNKTKSRSQDLISFSIEKDQTYYQPYSLIIDKEIIPGDYKIKIKIQKDDRKTLDEITNNITIHQIDYHINQSNQSNLTIIQNVNNSLVDSSIMKNSSVTNVNSNPEKLEVNNLNSSTTSINSTINNQSLKHQNSIASGITGAITNPLIYQSTGEKAKLLIPFFIITSCLILLVYLWKKETNKQTGRNP